MGQADFDKLKEEHEQLKAQVKELQRVVATTVEQEKTTILTHGRADVSVSALKRKIFEEMAKEVQKRTGDNTFTFDWEGVADGDEIYSRLLSLATDFASQGMSARFPVGIDSPRFVAKEKLSVDGVRAKLRKAADESGMTREEIGVRMGHVKEHARSHVSRMLRESPTINPRLGTVLAFCEAINRELRDILAE